MDNMSYATAVNDRHDVRLRTWQERGVWWTEVTVDGRVMTHECLGTDR